MKFEDIQEQLGQPVTVTLTDGTQFQARLTSLALEREVELRDDPILPSNMDRVAGPPHTVLYPAKATITLKTHEGDLHGTASA